MADIAEALDHAAEHGVTCRITDDLPWPVTALEHETTLWIARSLPITQLPEAVDEVLRHRCEARAQGRRHLRVVPDVALAVVETCAQHVEGDTA